MDLKIAFIGGGNMGEAMVSCVLSKGLARPETLWVSDASEARCQLMRQKYGVTAKQDNIDVAGQGDIVVLAVKPQNLSVVTTELKGKLRPEQLVISIIAGARIETIKKGLEHGNIVRVMPNTPAQIGEGMSVWTAAPGLTNLHSQWASAILRAMGREIYVQNEDYIDKATAVSGSGPAYLFLFVEAMTAAAVKIGFSQQVAEGLVLQTVLGAAHFLQKSGKTPAELRRNVTSPGGTTAEALGVFESGGFMKLFEEALSAAYEKAKKLGS